MQKLDSHLKVYILLLSQHFLAHHQGTEALTCHVTTLKCGGIEDVINTTRLTKYKLYENKTASEEAVSIR